jgi:hypothetical protein
MMQLDELPEEVDELIEDWCMRGVSEGDIVTRFQHLVDLALEEYHGLVELHELADGGARVFKRDPFAALPMSPLPDRV